MSGHRTTPYAAPPRLQACLTDPQARYYGYWEIEAVDEPRSFAFSDGFALDDTFMKNPELPVTHSVFSFTEHAGGTRATYVSTYATAVGLQQVLDMGVVEGASTAINQIDDLVA